MSSHARQVKTFISGSNWSAVLHIVTSMFDSGFFLPNNDSAACEKFSTLLLSAVKFVLKCKQPQRACELMHLAMNHTQCLLNTEIVSVFAMGMRRSTPALFGFSDVLKLTSHLQFES